VNCYDCATVGDQRPAVAVCVDCGAALCVNAIFEYLEIFHNRQRRHSALGMLTPVEFEAAHQPVTAA
jgi:hypothetical protein